MCETPQFTGQLWRITYLLNSSLFAWYVGLFEKTRSQFAMKDQDVLEIDDSSYPSLGILALSELVIGMTNSFMTPFYSKEAVQRGMSITEAGVVYSIMYLIIMMCSPIFGKYIDMVGSRKMFLLGTMVAGLGYSCFGFLQWVVRKQMFFSLSLLLRMILSVAEAAHFTAITPLTIAAASEPSND